MADKNTVTLRFAGDTDALSKSFDKVGGSVEKLSANVNVTTGRFNDMGRAVGDQEAGLQGFADLMDGLGSTLGLPTEGLVSMTRGLADISGGLSTVMPIVSSVTGLLPGLSGAMTLISAHPLVAGLLVGGAIIAGLILLERKFGIVSGAVGALGDAFKAAWENGIKPALNFIIGGIELYLRAMAMPFTLLNKVPGVGSLIPDGLANIKLPRLDVGGSVLQTGVAVVHRGEHVIPQGSAMAGGGTTVHVHVAGSVMTERDIVRAVRDGLARDSRLGA
ncbi:MAG TPA: hypothetical protein VF244_10430 [Acidimicrobiales bacterium]